MGGMTGLLLLLWAGVTVGSVVDLQKRIIGGHDCTKAEHPYHVVLTSKKDSSIFHCSGSLIHKEWILTAAHCWEPEPGRTLKVVFRNSKKKVKIIEKNIFKHEGKDDIMLLKISGKKGIQPVKLPVDCPHPLVNGDKVQIAGFASSTPPRQLKELHHIDFSKLHCATTKVDKCDALCLQQSNYNYPHLLCYKDDKVDTSPGDSGAGVEYKGRIYGVHVRSEEKACSGSAESMDVCSYKDWIINTTSITTWP